MQIYPLNFNGRLMIADISLTDIVTEKSFFPSWQRSPEFLTRLATTATRTRYSVIKLAVPPDSCCLRSPIDSQLLHHNVTHLL
ncbi:hypothetical protein [Microcoleus sp. PH2017_02_FOX_O_A]|uniref:hypothetical protein n=1 Tax=Microcoleus sp. PH2017_02_FOX_O_A TaxID=2798813 RepID=UPI0025D787A3|nr:hypothetical protein [Microcoleus sp. PH2017_02_FOX_O_A]